MIPLLRRHAVRELDRDAIERIGLPGVVLMENAGKNAFERICERFSGVLGRVVVVGGPGQNGGDGWVIARHLHCAGRSPRALLVGEPERVRGDAAVNLRVLRQLGVDLQALAAAGDGLFDAALATLDVALADATLVVDALFGTGLDRPLSGLHAEIVARINACPAPVVALDLPSGVDGDSGAVLGADSGAAVDADLTVTFAAHKRGLHQYPGAGLAGDLCCVSIGVPAPRTAPVQLLEAVDIARAISPRAADAHKGSKSAGHVLVFAGAPGRTGAAVLSGLGALRAGAGLVTLVSRHGGRDTLDAKVVELMTDELPAEDEAARAHALALCAGKSAAVVGPGLGLDEAGRALSRALSLSLEVPAVLDADALTALGSDLGTLRNASAVRVLTPHPGEAARLLGVDAAAIQRDRYAAAQQIAERSGQVVVLKGARTVIAQPGGRMRVSPSGTPAMAVAGMGDVLSGAVAALLGQLGALRALGAVEQPGASSERGASAFDAASAAVYLHGLAGELAARADRGLFASELAGRLPDALARCRGPA